MGNGGGSGPGAFSGTCRQQWAGHCAAVLLGEDAATHPPLRKNKTQRFEFPESLKSRDVTTGEEPQEIKEAELESGVGGTQEEDVVV